MTENKTENGKKYLRGKNVNLCEFRHLIYLPRNGLRGSSLSTQTVSSYRYTQFPFFRTFFFSLHFYFEQPFALSDVSPDCARFSTGKIFGASPRLPSTQMLIFKNMFQSLSKLRIRQKYSIPIVCALRTRFIRFRSAELCLSVKHVLMTTNFFRRQTEEGRLSSRRGNCMRNVCDSTMK